MIHKKKYGYRCDEGHEFEVEQFIDGRSTPITHCRVSCCTDPKMRCGPRARTCDAPCRRTEVTTYEEKIEKGRIEYAKATSGARRYAICTALDMTKLSIELERLERLGVSKKVTKRWKDRGRYLLDEILEVSDPLSALETGENHGSRK